MRCLLVERDGLIAQSISLMLESEGMKVYVTDVADEAVDLALLYDFDLILLDTDRFETPILRQLRVAKVSTPVLVLSGTDTVSEKVVAFGHGADDHLSKPFHRDELVARIYAVVRRSRGLPSPTVTIGDLVVLIHHRRIEVAGRHVHLTGKEYQMLELFALRQGSVLTKEMVMNHVYGGLDEPEIKIIDVFVCKLRKKLAMAGSTARIETVWGRGYTLAGPRALAA